ncbi:hypothetical protein TWF694_005070 [Orbilia ellipsospora]
MARPALSLLIPGSSKPTPSILLHSPAKSSPKTTQLYIPFELQDMIIEAADNSQYSTLMKVCKYWRSRTLKVLRRRRYQNLYLSNEDVIKHSFGAKYATVTNKEAPFLIHRAIFQFKINAIDIKRPRTFLNTLYWTPDMDAEGESVRPTDQDSPNALNILDCLEDPIFVSQHEDGKPLPYAIRIGWSFPRGPRNQGRYGMGSFAASSGRSALRPRNTMKVKEFISLYFGYREWRTLTPAGPRNFVQHVGLWSPDEVNVLPPAQREEVKFIDVRFIQL